MKLEIKYTDINSKLHYPQIPGDAGYDIVATSIIKSDLFSVWYDTGVHVAIPNGYVGILLPRSGVTKYGAMQLANGAGVIDASYRGSIQVRFNRTFKGFFTRQQYKVGERIAQLIIMPIATPELALVDTLDKTGRNDRGFNSTGTTNVLVV